MFLVGPGMTRTKNYLLEALSHSYPIIARLICIIFGIIMMGFEDFARFYFVHMILNSIIIFFDLNSDVHVIRSIKEKGVLEWKYFIYISAIHSAISIAIFISYMGFIVVFDQYIAPGFLDRSFAELYALTILSCLLTPFLGIMKAKAPDLTKQLILRGNYVLVLAILIGIAAFGVDPSAIPYAWLFASLVLTALGVAVTAPYLLIAGSVMRPVPNGKRLIYDIWQALLAFSANRTNRRMTFLAAKAGMSAFLGPFASLVLKTVGFDKQATRRRLLDKFSQRWPWPRLTRLFSRSPASNISVGHVLWTILLATTAALISLMAFSGGFDPLILLGYLALASKILSISLRAILLNKLTSQGPYAED